MEDKKKLSNEETEKVEGGGHHGIPFPHGPLPQPHPSSSTQMKCLDSTCGGFAIWSGNYTKAGPYECPKCHQMTLYSEDCFDENGNLIK